MGTIDMYKIRYDYSKNYYTHKRIVEWNGLVACKTFLNNLTFTKANKTFKCVVCGKDKSKNTRYVGGYYEKVCINCFPEWVDNSIKALQEMIWLLEKQKEDLKLNEKKWNKEMIIGSLN